MRRTAIMGAVGLLTLLLAACSPVPSNPRAALEQKAAAVQAAVQELYETIDAAGLTGATGAGVVDQCGGTPVPGVSYSAGIGVPVGDQSAAGFEALTSRLTASGWKATAGEPGDDETRWGQFTRGDVRLDVKTGGFTYAGERRDEDRMALTITLKNPCVRIPDDTSSIDFLDMEKEILPRS